MTEKELEKVKFKFVTHLSLEGEHSTTFESEDHRLGFCDHVPYKDGMPKGRAYRHWRIGNKVFTNYQKFLEALKDL